MAKLTQGATGDSPLNPLEVKIIKKVCEEKSNQEIAQELFYSIRSIETYRSAIMQKIGAKSVAGVVMYAVRNGLVNY